MSLVLLFPLGLAALAAWALPLLLHLVRREQQVPTEFAALRWLAIRAKPRTRVRFDEWLLLCVRLALIAALALLLARPAVVGGDGGIARVVAVHPGVDAGAVAIGSARDDRRVVWLAPGFPPFDTPPPAVDIATASLVRELDASLAPATQLQVFVPARFTGADGERPRLARDVAWTVADAPRAAAPSASTASPVPRLVIRHDDAHADGVRWLRAAAIAWHARDERETAPADDAAAEHRVDVAPVAAALPASSGDVLAWLAAGALPASTRDWIDAGGTALLAHDADWPLDAAGAPLADDAGVAVAEAASFGRGRIVRLQRPLQPSAWPALLDASFPRTLRTLVVAPAPTPTLADAAAYAPEAGGPGFAPAPREFPHWLVAIVLGLFAFERWLATGRRPAVSA